MARSTQKEREKTVLKGVEFQVMGEKHGSDSGGELGAIGLQFHQMSRRKDNVGGRFFRKKVPPYLALSFDLSTFRFMMVTITISPPPTSFNSSGVKLAVSKLYASNAHVNSVLIGMKNQLVVLRVAGSLQKSKEVMKAMQSLVKIPEIQATMRELSKEMMKAGIIEEMLEDTFESMDDQEEMEKAAEMEIDKILFEITTGALGKAPSKVTDAFLEPRPSGAMAASEDEKEEEALEAMQSHLATLRS
ncbi:charged multivesicular body protein 3-like [Lynx canadensis]|uniref:charged multivesicular body protein 3-like n=1 Tax=Lynx canadensis TaxID=61383 RepID=UPI0011B0DE26|nr:charged multivesicular body protein 3-like [Lynx canadensis]